MMGNGEAGGRTKNTPILIGTLRLSFWRLKRKERVEKGSHGSVSLALRSFEVRVNKFFSHTKSESQTDVSKDEREEEEKRNR